MSRRHPQWVYAGLSAAAAMNLEYSWSLLRDESIYVASSPENQSHRRSQTVPIFVASEENCVVRYLLGESMVAVRTTTPARTLVDCALRYPFRLVLGMFDSAFRMKLTDADSVVDECDRIRADCGSVFRLLRYTDARSENGGESLCRATLIDAGFAVPELQREFVDPENSWNVRRVDFVWHTADGRTIVLEYDGMRKYVDPVMTKRRDIQQVVSAEKSRDDMLLRAGVSAVVHATYDDVVTHGSLWSKLIRAGVPRTDAIPFYELK
ncbi:CTP synthase [Bifidobacterium callitrichidarum]|uniref:CTP synthase n=1 Tax=Bifidobacterium callitrichidarum TaxID=2052941 RepID=A0A2U2N4P7_9BIFI|nr:CTP synthase [Bifidobacterium callitrichidarum]